jgi:hypothetical protein
MTLFRSWPPSGINQASAAARDLRCALGALVCVLLLASLLAAAPVAQAQQQPESPAAEPPPHRPGLLDALGRWFGDSKAAIDSQIRGTQENLGTLGSQARDAAGTVAAMPGTRIIAGRQLCPVASNGAPDCQQGAEALCRSKGLQTGRSLDVTSSQRCSAQNWIAGRTSKESACRLETYVTRAVCQ